MADSATADVRKKQNPFYFFPPALALLFIPLAVYLPALHGQFVWDDQLLIEKNPLVTGKATLATIWFETDFSLTSVALWLQWLVFGNNPAGFHAVNVALHSADCLLLWRVLLRLKIPGAFVAAILFAAHPVSAASVAWISEMKNTLSLLFFLLSFLAFLKSDAEVENRTRAKIFYTLSLISFLLALLSKTSTVMLPVILFIYFWQQRNFPPLRDALRLLPFFLLALALGGATIWFQSRVMAAHEPMQTENLLARIAAAGNALWFYLGKIFRPLNLSLIYPKWNTGATGTTAMLPLLGWLAMIAVLWFFRRHVFVRAAFFALICFTILLLPVLGILSMDYLAIARVSDHFAYLPMIPILALIAAVFSKFFSPAILPAAAAMLVIGLGVLTFQRAEIIANNETLWRDVLEKNPNSFTARNNFGCVLAAQNKMDDAIAQFRAAIEIRSNNAPAHCNLGRAYAIQNNFDGAENEFQTALKLKPADADIQQSYASALAEQGKISEAIPHLREAVRLEPRPELRLRLAAALHQTGNAREAVEQYRAALAREPNSIEALNNLAWILATSRDASLRNGAEATRFAERACSITNRKNPMTLGTLAAAQAEAGKFSEAVATATEAATLADAQGNANFAALNRQLIELFRAGKPARE